MAIVVKKFGGTSVATPERIRDAAERVRRARERGERPVVVISAMGHTTDELLALAGRVAPVASRRQWREMDLLLSTGEQVAAALLALALEEAGVPALSLTGPQAEVLTDETHSAARIRGVRARRVRQALREGRTPVVAGFQGLSSAGEVTTLGRGGSDTTAVALAVAVRARRCDIYTDVDGVYSADPRKLAQARRHPRLAHSEALLLMAAGAVVLHPRAAMLAAAHGLTVRVLSSLVPDEERSTIIEGEAVVEGPRILGVAAALDAARVTVKGPAESISASHVLGSLAAAGIPVDSLDEKLLAAGGRRVSLLVPAARVAEIVAVLSAATPAATSLEVEEPNARVTVVGTGLSACGAEVARALQLLVSAGIQPAGVAVTDLGLTLEVPPHHADETVRTLHECLIEHAPAPWRSA